MVFDESLGLGAVVKEGKSSDGYKYLEFLGAPLEENPMYECAVGGTPRRMPGLVSPGSAAKLWKGVAKFEKIIRGLAEPMDLRIGCVFVADVAACVCVLSTP